MKKRSVIFLVIWFVPLAPLFAAQQPKSSLDPFQQELMNKLRQKLPAKPPQAPAPKPAPTTPTPPAKKVTPAPKPAPPREQEKKELEQKQHETLTDAFWGTANAAKNVWQETQQLLTDHKDVAWEGWQQKPYDRLAELRDIEAPAHSKALAELLPVYITVYGELQGMQRTLLMKLVNTIASALFGSLPLNSLQQKDVRTLVGDIARINKTASLVTIINTILNSKKVTSLATKPSNGKKAADIKQQKIDACLEKLRQFHRDDLEKQRQDLMNIFFEITGMNEQQWNKYVHKERPALIKELQKWVDEQKALKNLVPLKSRSRIPSIVLPLLKKAGLENKNIELLHTVDVMDFGASPMNIQFNEPLVEQYSDKIIEVGALHEIQHIVFDDYAIRICMEDKLNAPQIVQYKDSFLNLWNFFKEKRADIFAWLTSLEHLDADLEFWRGMPEELRYKEDAHHLHSVQRMAIAEEIKKQMLECYNQ